MLATRVLLFVLFAGSMSSFCAAQRHAIPATPAQRVLGEAVVSAGMHIEETVLDCSHFVNSLFDQIGIYYKYEPSRVLYRGVPGFKRVYRPIEGDLIVWPGHVGIVVDPAEKTFLSALRRGVRVSSYASRYWLRRGHPRFFRYALRVPPSTWTAQNWQPSPIISSDAPEQ